MECVICKRGTTRSGFVTVTLERDDCIVILKQVPADICQNCGEYYLSESVTAEVLQKAEDAVNKGIESFFVILVKKLRLFGLCYAMEGEYKGCNPYIERHLAIFVNCFLSRAN